MRSYAVVPRSAVTTGQLGGPAGPVVKALVEDLASAGVAAASVDDLAVARWRKLVGNVPFNGLSVVLARQLRFLDTASVLEP